MFGSYFGYSAPTPSPSQIQTQLNLQKLETKQSVVNSIGMFLAIAEGYLIRNGIKIRPLFAYYDHFNVTSERPELIRLKLMNNYMTFSAQKQNYLNKFHAYDFYPDNFSAEQIKNIIQEWIPYATQIGEQELYMNILNLFNDDSSISNNQNKYSYYKDIQGYNDTNPESNIPMDPRDQAKAIANIHAHKAEENRRNKEKLENTGKYEINLILNGKAGTSSLSEKMKPITDKNPKQIQEDINAINTMKDMTLQLIASAKGLYICNKNERKQKRKGLYTEIENMKKNIKIFKNKFGSLEPLWEKIKYKSEIKNPMKKLMEACESDEDYKLFQKIDSLYDPEL